MFFSFLFVYTVHHYSINECMFGIIFKQTKRTTNKWSSQDGSKAALSPPGGQTVGLQCRVVGARDIFLV